MSWLDLSEDKLESFEPVPAGRYAVTCEKAEVRDTKAPGGQYINTVFKIVTGDQEGRVVFHMFNIKNKNEKAVQIGRGQLKSFLAASGQASFSLDTVSDLEGMKCVVTTKVKTDDYGDKAAIKAFLPLEEEPVSSKSGAKFSSDDIPF